MKLLKFQDIQGVDVIGLLDYEYNELNLNLKDVTLKELLKEVLNKILK